MAVSEITLETIKLYVEKHCEPGGFMRAVLENNLVEAFARADMQNRAALFEIVQYCYNEIPHICWGSPERVKAWLNGRHESE